MESQSFESGRDFGEPQPGPEEDETGGLSEIVAHLLYPPQSADWSIAVNESSLRRTLKSFFAYNHDSRCHLALNKDSPETREVQPPDKGIVVEIPRVGALHHRYERRAA